MRMRQINLDMTLRDIGVDPCENFFSFVEKYHVFVDNEVSVVVGQSSAGIDNSLSKGVSLFGVIILLQFYDLLVL